MKKFGPDWPRSCSDTFGEEWKQRHSLPRCLDFEQVLASSRCTASSRHNHGTVCRAVLDVLQVIASSHCTASCRQNPAPCAALCWMSCKCSLLRTAPQVFVTATPCAALCWMSCKCSHLRAAPDLFVTGKHPVPNVSEPLRAECVRTTPYFHKQKCFVFA